MTTNRPPVKKKIVEFLSRRRALGDGDSATQKRALGALPDAVRATKKSSTPVASGTTAEKGAADRDYLPYADLSQPD